MDNEIRELERAIERIWEIGHGFGLDPFPTNFEIVPATVMYEVGSYALPGRYSHWTFGKAYHRMKMMYDFGLSRIYEVVINSNPSYGFLLETNSPLQNKLVIAHVMGHVDFFKNNVWFSQTNRRMVDDAATHARRISEYEFTHGRKVVEKFLDAVLSIEEHVDPHVFIKKDAPPPKPGEPPARRKEGRYDDLLSPDELPKPPDPADSRNPEIRLPEKDLLFFLMKYSPTLEPWQRDVISMIREEMIYFVPQMQTKTINEGWACATGDSLVLTEEGFVRFDRLYEARRAVSVAAGAPGRVFRITDFHREEQVPTIRIRTARGYEIEGALEHRVLLADGRWTYLKDVAGGDRVAIDVGSGVWPAARERIAGGSARSGAAVGTAPAPVDVATLDDVPERALRAPKAVAAAFVRELFDSAAEVDAAGITLAAPSAQLLRTVQVVLLNFGVQSTRDRALRVSGASAVRFLEQIGLGDGAKRAALRAYVERGGSFEREAPADEVVAIEHGRADVYDITVDTKHAYVANGFVNHNSFWHSRIMRDLELSDVEHLEFAELHSSVVSPHKGQLNPYFVGYKILEDIEKRFGRAKLFEVREIENDVSLLRNYLTEELCDELDLFVFELVDGENWTVTEKMWERVRDQLVANIYQLRLPVHRGRRRRLPRKPRALPQAPLRGHGARPALRRKDARTLLRAVGTAGPSRDDHRRRRACDALRRQRTH